MVPVVSQADNWSYYYIIITILAMLGLSCMYNGGIMYYILKEHNRILLKGYEYVVHLSQIWMHNGLCGMCLRNFCKWIFVVKIDGLRILTKFKCLGPVWVRHTKCPLLLELLQQSHKSYSQYKSLKGGGGGGGGGWGWGEELEHSTNLIGNRFLGENTCCCRPVVFNFKSLPCFTFSLFHRFSEPRS